MMQDTSDRREQFLEMLDKASSASVDDIKTFVRRDFSLPLYITGSGGSFPSCSYAALLHQAAGGFAHALTPYTMNSVSDKSLAQSKLIVISSSLKNADSKYIIERGKLLCKNNLCVVSKNNLVRGGVFKSDFVSTDITNLALIHKVYSGDINVSMLDINKTFSSLVYDNCYDIPLTDVLHFVVVYGSWGAPAAVDLETRFVESGMASVQLSDYRNFCHGRFLFVSNHIGINGSPKDTAMVLIITPREKNISKRLIELMPKETPVIILETEKDNPMATIELTMQGIRLFDAVGAARGINPCNPKSMGGIDKRYPQSHLAFKSDFKNNGALLLPF